MPYSNKQMLRDANGDLIPQYWDITAGEFKPLTGQGGANDVRLTGSNVEYYNDVEIASGESFNTDFFNVDYANNIIVTLSDRGNERIRDDLELRVTFRRGDNSGLFVYAEKVDLNEGATSGYGKFVFDVLTPYFRLEFRNRSEHDGDNIQINIYGVNK